jgi:hypothetical protein
MSETPFGTTLSTVEFIELLRTFHDSAREHIRSISRVSPVELRLVFLPRRTRASSGVVKHRNQWNLI